MKLISPDLTRAYWKTTITHTWGISSAAFPKFCLIRVHLSTLTIHHTNLSLPGWLWYIPSWFPPSLKEQFDLLFFIHNTPVILLNWSDSQRVGCQVVHLPQSPRTYLFFFKTEVNHVFLSFIHLKYGHTVTNQPTLVGTQKSYTDTYLLFKFIYAVIHTQNTYVHTHALWNTCKEVILCKKLNCSGTKYCKL